MSKVLDFVKENDLAWQASFNGELDNSLFGYRGALIVEAGKQLSPDRVLPPKIQVKQVLMVCDDTINFLACEMETFAHFEPFFERYKAFLSPESKVVLFVIDLDDSGVFEYEGVTFNAVVLDESSVWNEMLEMVGLEKSELKKATPSEKIEAVYDEAIGEDFGLKPRSFEQMQALKSDTKKVMMGAV
jgi:hypothetical protein